MNTNSYTSIGGKLLLSAIPSLITEDTEPEFGARFTCKKLVPLALGAPHCEAPIHINEPLLLQTSHYAN